MQAIAAPNIALIKYWGKGDSTTNSPASGSISLTLSADTLWAKTQILSRDTANNINGPTMEINDSPVAINDSVLRLLDGFDQCAYWKKTPTPCTSIVHESAEGLPRDISIISHTNIPIGSGIASSAAGAAALTLALDNYYQTNFDKITLSCLARLYSGSGARSLYKGAVEMVYEAAAHPLLQWRAIPISVHPSFYSLECLILLFSCIRKPLPSTEAMNKCANHPSQKLRLSCIPTRLARCRSALQTGCFEELAEVCEEDWKCMHNVVQEATGISYVLEEGRTFSEWVTDQRRTTSLQAFCTYDAGPNCVIFGFPAALNRIRECYPHYQYITCKISW